MVATPQDALIVHHGTPKYVLAYLAGVLILVVFLMVSLVGCSDTDTGSEEKMESPKQETETLIIGLIPERNIFEQLERYKPLAQYLSKKIGMKVELKVLARYGNIIDNFETSKMDGAFFGSFTYALAHAKLGVEPLARPEDNNGQSTYFGILFVRKDSGITNAEDMRQKVFAFVDKATTAGYLLPMAYFKTQGITDYKTYFKETYFSGTHENAIHDVLTRRADVGAAKNTVFNYLSKIESNVRNDLVVLERSPDVPENGLAVRPDLDPSIKGRLREALTSMHEDPEGVSALQTFGVRKFIETKDSDYENVYRYARQAGMDLATYDYLND